MPRLVPGGPGRLDRLAPLLPSLEPPALQRQRPQHRPLRLAQVQVRRVCRLEHHLPPRIRPPEEQPIHRPVRRQVVDPRGAPLHLRRDPRLDPPWEVRPMGRVPAGGRGVRAAPVAGPKTPTRDPGPRRPASISGLARATGGSRPAVSCGGSVGMASGCGATPRRGWPGKLWAEAGPLASRQTTRPPGGAAVQSVAMTPFVRRPRARPARPSPSRVSCRGAPRRGGSRRGAGVCSGGPSAGGGRPARGPVSPNRRAGPGPWGRSRRWRGPRPAARPWRDGAAPSGAAPPRRGAPARGSVGSRRRPGGGSRGGPRRGPWPWGSGLDDPGPLDQANRGGAGLGPLGEGLLFLGGQIAESDAGSQGCTSSRHTPSSKCKSLAG